jgi:PTS system nitrogen regulatory IIA component
LFRRPEAILRQAFFFSRPGCQYLKAWDIHKMKISELLDPAAIVADLHGVAKREVLAELTDALLKTEPGLSRDDVLRVLMERERLGSTGIGDGVAIPHGKLKDIDRLLISFGLSRHGVDFDSMDGKPAHLFFLLVAPEESVGVHLKTLARISKLLKSTAVRERLQSAVDSAEIHRIIAEEEEHL